MKLYLVRHGEAAPKETDPRRPLTEEGRSDVEKIAAFLKPLNLCIDCLWYSPRMRAAQTAEILSAAVKVKEGVIERDGLAPNDNVMLIKDELTGTGQDIMIVGHLPFLARLSSLLLTGSESADTVAFKQAGLVCLSRSEQNQWQLDWIVAPQILA